MPWFCIARVTVALLRALRLLAEAFSSSELDTSGSGWSPVTQLGGAFHAAMSCEPDEGGTSWGGNAAGAIVCGDILRASVAPSRTLGGRETNGSLKTGPLKWGGEEDDEDGVGARASMRRPLMLASPNGGPEIGALELDWESSDGSMIPSIRSRLRSMLNPACWVDARAGCAELGFDFFLSRPRTARKAPLLGDGSIWRKELSPLPEETKAGRSGGALLAAACVCLSSASSLTLLRARLMTLSGFMKDLGFLSSLWPLLVELVAILVWSSALVDSVDRVERVL